MFSDLLSAHYDSYHPGFSLTLVNSLKSYINLKLDHERKTFDFVKELRRRLYFIHEYNCQVAKRTHQYPRSRKLDLLLIKYVEIEYDALYSNSYVSRQLEEATELRVLRLLQMMLYLAVLNNETLINKNTDKALKKAVLQLLGEVRSKYLVKNRLVYNIAHKLLKTVGGTFKKHTSNRSVFDIRGNLATSDYGSDDSDSDFENNTGFNESSPRTSQNSIRNASDCFEVPWTTNGQTPVPTVEFTDDDDYFVYLQKPASSKRKNNDDSKSDYRKKVFGEIKNNTDGNLINIRSKQKDNEISKRTSPTETSACVVICSDSEDEVPEVVSPVKKSNKPNTTTNKNVVTFEILDDDDDDDGQTNYMVYLQKEVETNTKLKKEKSTADEIVICSDSEDDSCVEGISSKIQQNDETERTDLRCNQTVPSLQVECIGSSHNRTSNENVTKMFDQTSEDNFNENEESNDKSLLPSNCNNKEENGVKPPSNQPDIQMPSTSKDVNTYFLNFSPQISTNETANYLVDPSAILQQISPIFVHQEETLTKQFDFPSSSHAEFDETDIPGGPLMSEKVDGVQELGNVSECRLNESLLEELLLDDTYLLEGHKEFEELEYFLFNDGADKGGLFLSNGTLDNMETALQPETFDADIKSLESLLDDSQLVNWTDCENGTSSDHFELSLVHKMKNEVDFNGQSNSDGCDSDKRDSSGCRKKNSKVVFKHSRRVSRR